MTDDTPTRPGYAQGLARYVRDAHRQEAIVLGAGIPTTTRELIAALERMPDGEVFIEVDRNMIEDLERGASPFDLLPYLYPVVARFDDQGDVILHVTDGDRAQS